MLKIFTNSISNYVNNDAKLSMLQFYFQNSYVIIYKLIETSLILHSNIGYSSKFQRKCLNSTFIYYTCFFFKLVNRLRLFVISTRAHFKSLILLRNGMFSVKRMLGRSLAVRCGVVKLRLLARPTRHTNALTLEILLDVIA